jgi:DNA-binding NarL/FixJ family response regulator
MKKHRIAIADDHLLFADGIAELIQKMPDMQMVFSVNTTDKLIKYLKKHKVDMLLLDLNIPPDNGLLLLGPLQEQYPSMKMLILSMYQPIDLEQDLAKLNADGYVLKTSGKAILCKAIEALKDGKKYMDPNINTRPLKKDAFTMSQQLTKREKSIVELIAKGKSNKQIAETLFLSELTVKTHRKNIKNKLGAEGKAELVFRSIRLFS